MNICNLLLECILQCLSGTGGILQSQHERSEFMSAGHTMKGKSCLRSVRRYREVFFLCR